MGTVDPNKKYIMWYLCFELCIYIFHEIILVSSFALIESFCTLSSSSVTLLNHNFIMMFHFHMIQFVQLIPTILIQILLNNLSFLEFCQ